MIDTISCLQLQIKINISRGVYIYMIFIGMILRVDKPGDEFERIQDSTGSETLLIIC